MEFSSKIPLGPHIARKAALRDDELEQIFDSPTVNQLMAETNARGFEIRNCSYDTEKQRFLLQLKGVTPEGNIFCGDTIDLAAARSDGKIKILSASVDRSYMCDADIDI